MAPAPRPMVQRTAVAVMDQPKPKAAAPAQIAAPVPLAAGVAPARIVAAASNAVVLFFSLEVVALQFSPSLQMAAVRARPASRTVTVQIDPQALSGATLPEAGFELGPVHLDARGQIAAIRLLPTTQAIANVQLRSAFRVGAVAILASNDGRAMELTPAPAAPMTMRLSAAFELAGVQLSPTFGIGSLLLRARSGEIRVSLSRDNADAGAKFKTAQVLLNRSAQIAEILLDAIA